MCGRDLHRLQRVPNRACAGLYMRGEDEVSGWAVDDAGPRMFYSREHRTCYPAISVIASFIIASFMLTACGCGRSLKRRDN